MKKLNEMTAKELKEMAKEQNIKNWWKMNKEQLIVALSQGNEIEETKEENTKEETQMNKEENISIIEKIYQMLENESDEVKRQIANKLLKDTKKKQEKIEIVVDDETFTFESLRQAHITLSEKYGFTYYGIKALLEGNENHKGYKSMMKDHKVTGKFL